MNICNGDPISEQLNCFDDSPLIRTHPTPRVAWVDTVVGKNTTLEIRSFYWTFRLVAKNLAGSIGHKIKTLPANPSFHNNSTEDRIIAVTLLGQFLLTSEDPSSGITLARPHIGFAASTTSGSYMYLYMQLYLHSVSNFFPNDSIS